MQWNLGPGASIAFYEARRLGSIRASGKVVSARLNDDHVRGGDIDIFSLGGNWWLNSDIS